MRKMLPGLLLLAAAGLAAAPAALAQKPAGTAPTAAELKENIARVAGGTEGESDAFTNLTAATARQLVAYLKTHEVTAAGAKALGLDYAASKGAGHLKVLTYSYSSGGTRGTIDKPVLQWHNAAGQRFAYASHEECSFYEIHKLASPGRTRYLLLGIEKGDGRCDVSQAYVVELTGNYLLADNPAFGKSSSLSLCNVDMVFDIRHQVLHIDQSHNKDIANDALRLKEAGLRRRPGGQSMVLKLSGGRFVQSQ